eukprot:421411_1
MTLRIDFRFELQRIFNCVFKLINIPIVITIVIMTQKQKNDEKHGQKSNENTIQKSGNNPNLVRSGIKIQKVDKSMQTDSQITIINTQSDSTTPKSHFIVFFLIQEYNDMVLLCNCSQIESVSCICIG